MKTLAADGAVSVERALTGRRVTQTWCVRRRWKQSRVVSECHYAHRQDGEALSCDDIRIAAPRDPDSVKPS
jgi:hypothetical protein